MNLDIIVFGAVTMRQCLYGLAGVVLLLMVVRIFKRLFFNKAVPMDHSVSFTCASCGWQGRIGQFATRCPKCGQSVRSNG